ncbi:hypothetical protein [Nocardia lijiangensis]|uniref:hypothetical protein n=1 Tax=Nocardia lijiangensis TaxID=299618 RepID=UPI00082DDB42|nr:hypothetical protein [Nocardia lijiangensis]
MYPPPGYPAYPPYGYVPPPSGGTAIMAGVLALLGGAYGGFTAISGFFALQRLEDVRRSIGSSATGPTETEFYAVVATSGGIAAMLLLGGILLLARKGAGRTLIVVACTLAVIQGFVSLGVIEDAGMLSESSAATVGLALGVSLPLLTGILAAVGSTARWVAAGRTPAAPPMYGPPPYAYGPPQYPHY